MKFNHIEVVDVVIDDITGIIIDDIAGEIPLLGDVWSITSDTIDVIGDIEEAQETNSEHEQHNRESKAISKETNKKYSIYDDWAFSVSTNPNSVGSQTPLQPSVTGEARKWFVEAYDEYLKSGSLEGFMDWSEQTSQAKRNLNNYDYVKDLEINGR